MMDNSSIDSKMSSDSHGSCVALKPSEEVLQPEQMEAEEANEIQFLVSRNHNSSNSHSSKSPQTQEERDAACSTLHCTSMDQNVATGIYKDPIRDTKTKDSITVREIIGGNPEYTKSVDGVTFDLEVPTTLLSHRDLYKESVTDAEIFESITIPESVEQKLASLEETSSVVVLKSNTEMSFALQSNTSVHRVSAGDFEDHNSFTTPNGAGSKSPGEPYLTVSALLRSDICETEITGSCNGVCTNSDRETEIQGSSLRVVEQDATKDEDHSQILALLVQLKTFHEESGESLSDLEYLSSLSDMDRRSISDIGQEVAVSEGLHQYACEGGTSERADGYPYSFSDGDVGKRVDSSSLLADFHKGQGRLDNHGLLFEEANRNDVVNLLNSGELAAASAFCSVSTVDVDNCQPSKNDILVRKSCEELKTHSTNMSNYEEMQQKAEKVGSHIGYRRRDEACPQPVKKEDSSCMSPCSPDGPPEPVWMRTPPSSTRAGEQLQTATDTSKNLSSYPAFKEVPGPCEQEDLLDGVIFGAKYLGSTQLLSEKNPSTSVRMAQAQEAVDRIKAPEGESQPMTEVDLFISSQRIKVLSADTQEAMMDHLLQTISYIADIGNILVLMARRKQPRKTDSEASGSTNSKKQYKMICHVFQSEDAQLIAQAIGQAFSVAYQLFLQSNGINPSELRPDEYSDVLSNEELYNGDLVHFSKRENCRDIYIRKEKGELLGVAIVESGWGSILPTVVIANLMHGAPAEKSGELNIGDRIMSANGTSLVGLSLTTCENIIRDLKYQTEVKLNIVHCPPVTNAIIKRPDTKYQLGFCVEDGIICSLMRGGIAERGGIRVGHRIIEINGQSVVATPHDKIIQILSNAAGEIHLKTMPASTYRLLTGQEQPVYL